MRNNHKVVLAIPTLEALYNLPPEVLWLEIAELAEHSVPPVAQSAEALLADRSVPPSPETVHALWLSHKEQTSVGSAERESACA